MYPHLFRRPKTVDITPERFTLSDGDFVDLQWAGPTAGPLCFLFHGLEGSGNSPYIAGLRSTLVSAGFQTVLMQFRGCSGVPNLLPRAYHSGDTADIREVIANIHRRHPGRWLGAVGFSLGGNALLKYLGEEGSNSLLAHAVAISVPFNLSRCADRLGAGVSKVYSWHLLRSLHAKVALRAEDLESVGVDISAALHSRSFRAFDEAVVAPTFGFVDAEDYYSKSSCGPFLAHIQTPTLILHAVDDPFMTTDSIPTEADLSDHVTLELSQSGGHVGFVSGPCPGAARYWLDERIRAELTSATE